MDRIKLANTLKVNTPKVYECNRDILCEIELDDVNFRLCVFKYIDGKSFYDLGIIPNSNEIKEIIRQMAIIHKATLQSDFIYDKWAIINFVKEFQDKKQHLNENDYKKLDELYNRFLQVDIEKLPKAFVHGDIISTNVMKDKNNKLWIIDFAVSNYVPRIIDLAVSSCNLCLDAENKENTKKKVKMILEEYQKYNKLTDYELEQFPLFFDIANAMGILQISHLNTLGESSEEDKFWYDESKKGLEFSNTEFWNDICVKEECER